MTDDLQNHPNWRWHVGMADTSGRMVVVSSSVGEVYWSDGGVSDGSEARPDLSNQQTLAIIERVLLPEQWATPGYLVAAVLIYSHGVSDGRFEPRYNVGIRLWTDRGWQTIHVTPSFREPADALISALKSAS